MGREDADLGAVFDAHVKAEFEDLGLLEPTGLPVTGVERAEAVLDPTRTRNALLA